MHQHHESEPLLTISQALTRLSIKVHIGTALRWRSRGVAGHRLKAIRVGGRWLTRVSWLRAFIQAVTAAADPTAPSESSPAATSGTMTASTIADHAHEEEIEAHLDQLGIRIRHHDAQHPDKGAGRKDGQCP